MARISVDSHIDGFLCGKQAGLLMLDILLGASRLAGGADEQAAE